MTTFIILPHIFSIAIITDIVLTLSAAAGQFSDRKKKMNLIDLCVKHVARLYLCKLITFNTQLMFMSLQRELSRCVGRLISDFIFRKTELFAKK